MWVAAAGSILGSLGKSGADKKASKLDFQRTLEENQQKGGISRQNSQFDAEQEYYYKQLQRQEAARGLAEFRKFSTVKDFAPGYENTNPNPVLPAAKPVFNAGAYAVTKK